MPAASTRPRSTPASSSSWSASPAARSRASWPAAATALAAGPSPRAGAAGGGVGAGGTGVDCRGPLGKDGVGEVGDRDTHVTVAEVDADERPRRLIERDEDRRPAALRAPRRRRALALDDQAGGLQVGDETGDRGAAEAGLAGDVGTADRPAVAESVHHAQAVALAQRLERAGPHLLH